MKRFFKLFVATAIPFGLFWGIWMYLALWSKKGVPLNACVLASICAGLFFGLFMAIFFRIFEKLALKKMGRNSSAISIKQEKEFTLALDYIDTLNKIKEKLSLLNAKVKSFDEGQGILIAKTRMTWKSFGEVISITIKKDSETRTHIRVESKPALVTTMVDYGKNLENVDKLYSLVTGELKA